MEATQELAKHAEQVQEQGRELDQKLEQAKSQLESITRIADGEEKNATKRQELFAIEEKIAELQRSLKMNDQGKSVPETGKSGNQTPVTLSSGQQERAGSKTRFIEVEDDDSEDGKPLAKRPRTAREVSTRTAAPAPATHETSGVQTIEDQPGEILNHAHGVWTEKIARDILRNNVEYPLIQTTLNYFESYMSEKLLDELSETLRSTPAARDSLQVLRQAWGGEKKDYFSKCAISTKRRGSPRDLTWNKYYQKGYLVRSHGGPRITEQNMSLAKYRKSYLAPLFGHEFEPWDIFAVNSDAERAGLTKLYCSFLQTEFAELDPAMPIRLGFLARGINV